MWYAVDSGLSSGSVAGMGVVAGSIVADLLLGLCVLYGVGRKMAAGGVESPRKSELMLVSSSMTPRVREDPQSTRHNR